MLLYAHPGRFERSYICPRGLIPDSRTLRQRRSSRYTLTPPSPPPAPPTPPPPSVVQALDAPDTGLLCSIYDALARTMAASKTSSSPRAKVEEFCSRAIGALDRPPGTNSALATGGAGGATKGGGGAKGEEVEPCYIVSGVAHVVLILNVVGHDMVTEWISHVPCSRRSQQSQVGGGAGANLYFS